MTRSITSALSTAAVLMAIVMPSYAAQTEDRPEKKTVRHSEWS